jgi:hypothetical protein
VSFAAACRASADDADIVTSAGVDDNQQLPAVGPAQRHKSIFRPRVRGIGIVSESVSPKTVDASSNLTHAS